LGGLSFVDIIYIVLTPWQQDGITITLA